MTPTVQPSRSGARGIDTVTVFHDGLANQVHAVGYEFVVRYLGSLTVAERDCILKSGLALLAVGYSRRPGWMPTGDMGSADGLLAVSRAQHAGLPDGMSLYCDMEGPNPLATQTDCITYVNGWAREVIDAGYRAGLYVGYGLPLTSEQLYHSLLVTGYWHSCSHVPGVATRGYQMTQQAPGNVHMFGTLVDIDTIQTDGKGDVPHWLIGSNDAV